MIDSRYLSAIVRSKQHKLTKRKNNFITSKKLKLTKKTSNDENEGHKSVGGYSIISTSVLQDILDQNVL